MKIGIYSCSYNPIHKRHIALANYLISNNIVDEVWIVVSPQNPLKCKYGLLNDNLRLKMAKIAFRYSHKIKISDVEFYLPKPNYTIDTLNFLQLQYPNNQFFLIIGADNVAIFDKWKNYNEILEKYSIIVYPRAGYEIDEIKFSQMKLMDAQMFNISASEIRKRIANKQNISELLPKSVVKFIEKNKLYYT
jgi:nicotinate-nucleotide adenylyltransferase